MPSSIWVARMGTPSWGSMYLHIIMVVHYDEGTDSALGP